MSALEAASAGVRDMADGSLRITIEFEPRFAKDAYALFGARGTPLAIAALAVGYAQKTDTSGDHVQKTPISLHDKPKGGPLSKLAAMWCNDPEFWDWLNTDPYTCPPCPEGAADCIYALCKITSRAELDNDEIAAEKFHRLIRGPYSKYLQARGVI